MSGGFDRPAVVIGGLKLHRSFMGTGIPIISVPRSQSDLVHYSRLFKPSGLSVADLQDKGDAYFLERLIDLAGRTQCRPVLYYGDDEVLGFLARNRTILERHFLLALPPSETLLGCLSKISFAELATKAGLPVPKSKVLQPDLSSEVVASVVGFPCVIKPDSHVGWNPSVDLVGSAGREQKVLVARDAGEYRATLDAMPTLVCASVVQEYLEGSESEIYSYHAYVSSRDGIPVSFVGRKIRTLPSSCGESSYLELVKNSAVTNLGNEVVRKLNIRGPVKIDLKRSLDAGQYFVLEVNLRYSLWNYLGACCGINLPLIAYRDLTDNSIDPKPEKYQTKISWLDWNKDIRSVAKYYIPSGEISISQWLQSLMRPKVYAVLSWRDPLPFLVHSVRQLRFRLGQFYRWALS